MVYIVDDPDEKKKNTIKWYKQAWMVPIYVIGASLLLGSCIAATLSKPWISVNPGDKFAYYSTSEENPFEGPSKIITILEVREGWAKFEITRPGSELSTDTDSVENIRMRYLKVTK